MKHCDRPFDSVEEMDEALIKNINDRIDRLDHFYILGDFARRDPDKYRQRIKCKYVHLIKGNHDKGQKFSSFQSVKDYDFKKFQLSDGNDQKIALFHYPMVTWDCKHHGSWSLYGHIHNRPLSYANGLSIHVGVDVHNYYPVSLSEIENLIIEKKI